MKRYHKLSKSKPCCLRGRSRLVHPLAADLSRFQSQLSGPNLPNSARTSSGAELETKLRMPRWTFCPKPYTQRLTMLSSARSEAVDTHLVSHLRGLIAAVFVPSKSLFSLPSGMPARRTALLWWPMPSSRSTIESLTHRFRTRKTSDIYTRTCRRCYQQIGTPHRKRGGRSEPSLGPFADPRRDYGMIATKTSRQN